MNRLALSCDQPGATHDHGDHHDAERATRLVLGLTLVTMVAEIAGGWWTGSMALLADGWHMGMHAAAMGVAVFAYRFARRHRTSGRYAFGAGKAGELGAFANAVMLAVVAVLIAGESAARLVTPGPIAFGAALTVAIIGLVVNLLSAWLLREAPHDHGHEHGHDHGHDHGGGRAHDHNREAAFVHVLADALTSGLAIVALWCGREFGLTWLDPLTGLVGAAIILRWSVDLVRRSGAVLLDAAPTSDLSARIVAIAEQHGDRVRDLHVWPIAAGRYAVAVGVEPGDKGDYRAELRALPGVAHLTLERLPRLNEHRHAGCANH